VWQRGQTQLRLELRKTLKSVTYAGRLAMLAELALQWREGKQQFSLNEGHCWPIKRHKEPAQGVN
jgi:hypothetical protein